ncbi:MAG: hypothetical protein OK454_08010 [Thaumarchaeota archaeon]|nr:hypothetical protein [Nitrososphaerota archaeon]
MSILNLVEEVEHIVYTALASHVTKADELTFSVNTFTETTLQPGEKGMVVVQTQCLGIWMMLDTETERLTTRWSCAIEDYTETAVRVEIVKVWDALVVQRMELDLKR